MKKYFLVALLLIACNQIFAQLGMGKPEDIKEIASRPLLVILRQEDPKILDKYSNKPEELQAYRNAIANYNEGAKAAFTRDWKFSKEVKFVSRWEYDSIVREVAGMKTYAYFELAWHTLRGRTTARYEIMPLFNIGLASKDTPVYSQPLCSDNLHESDFVYAIEQILIYFDQRTSEKKSSYSEIVKQIDARTPSIKSKTLLIDKDTAYEALVKNIATIYTYKYELCSKEVIEKAIVNHDPAYAYVASIVTPGATEPCDLVYWQYVASAEDGTTMFMMGSDSKPKVSKSDINRLAKKLNKAE